jgi:hypothetical protein
MTKITTYFEQLNTRSQEIFSHALTQPHLLGKAHTVAYDLSVLATVISDLDEKEMLKTVCVQIESSCLALSLGLYRPAIGGLRLALELGLGCMYFSANKLAHREWMQNGDLKWSVVNSETDGALSQRFVKAFFPELCEAAPEFFTRAGLVYRALSEYVHGNSDTWLESGLALTRNDALRSLYNEKLDEVALTIKFAFCCRYLKALTEEAKDIVSPATADLNYVAAVREILGGPKDIK